MSYVESVYLASILGAICFFAGGYLYHASRVAGGSAGSRGRRNTQASQQD